MRNWNNTALLTLPAPPLVYSVPMRNWNCGIPNAREAIRSFIPYLWGIETYFYNALEIEPTCLFRTYEELKLKFFCFGSFWQHPFIPYLWGIETYKSLAAHPVKWNVYSVPMRNWNCSPLPYLIYDFHEFIPYLWGIETVSFRYGTCYT